MPHLFEPFRLRGVTFPHRIVVSPMCQYSAENGHPTDWHFVHLGSFALGGAALVFTEATAVTPEGRISPADTGIWNDAQAADWARIVRFVNSQGSFAGIQLAHAGRKASTSVPWVGLKPVPPSDGGWTPVAPSALPFSEGYPVPHELSTEQVRDVVRAFLDATRRASDAGFQVVEIHSAHGYLLHEFLSPLSNKRTDFYGGSFENRIRLLCEVVSAVRAQWGDERPLFVRVSATDWAEGGWTPDDTVELAKRIAPLGADLLDCSSGGNVPNVNLFQTFGYQTAFAERVRRETGMPTGAVGQIVNAVQADHIIRSGQADMVLMAREMLRDPHFPLRAARELGQPTTYPKQYLRSGPEGSTMRKPVQ